MGKTRGGKTRYERGATAPKVPRPYQVGDLGEEWGEARQWAGDRITKKKYKMPAMQKPDSTVAGSPRDSPEGSTS